MELRRSARIAALKLKKEGSEQQKNTPPLKTSKVIKKTPRVRKEKKIDWNDIMKIKLNQLFPLIKQYSINEEEKNFKYSLLQLILKNYKKIGIKNNFIDFKENLQKVVEYLYLILPDDYNLIQIQDSLNDICSYPELSQSMSNTSNIDDIISLMLNCNLKQTPKNNIGELCLLFSNCNM